MVGVVYNSITTTRWRRKRQRPTVTGDISMESHSQYLASPPLLFMTEVSLHAFKVLFVLTSHYYCLQPKVSKGSLRKAEK